MFEHFGDRQYQDAWVKGELQYKGYRECEARFEVIRRFLEERECRPRTMLDFGALFGYFSLRLSETYGTFSLAIDHNPLLVEVVDANRTTPRPNYRVQAVHRKISSAEEIREFGKFDIVLVMSVLHHTPDWLEFLNAFQEAATEWLFVEPPHPQEKTRNAVRNVDEIHGEVLERGKVIGEAPAVYSAPKGAKRMIFALSGRGKTISEHPYVGPE